MNLFTKRRAIAKAIRKIEEKNGIFLFKSPSSAAPRTLAVRLAFERILGSRFFDTPEALVIEGFDAEDEALAGIALFELLKELIVCDSEIGDQFVVQITHLKSLENLSLVNTEVTDSGLLALASIETLQSLMIAGSHVTSEGIGAFKRARPNCEVIENTFVDPEDPFHVVACYDGFRCQRCGDERSLDAPSWVEKLRSLREQVEKLKDDGWVVRHIAEGDLYVVTCPKCSTEG